MKWLAVGIGVIFLSPLMIAGVAMALVSSSEAAQTTATLVPCVPAVDIDKIADQVSRLLDGASSDDVHVEGLDLPAEQIPAARTIVSVGLSLDVPTKGQIIALATAMQESRLRNLNYGDRDSLGLFQQRPSQGWGTAEQIHDPVHASKAFFTHLLKVPGWEQMTVTQAAQAVQKSGLPDAYAQWEPLATALQTAIARTFPGHGTDKGQAGKASTGVTGCAGNPDGSAFGRIPEGSVPKGYSIPANTDPKARTAIKWAMRQLGTLYQWGGSCTAAHGPDPMGRCDCSSLVQQAYAQAGITLTRTTYTQVREGKAISLSHLEPGDLVFSRGIPTRPEHVGIYLGEGLVIEAPRTSAPVRITPVKEWTILAARRVA
ncbi:C40 family peptidase [Streptomyces sp. NPDC001665]